MNQLPESDTTSRIPTRRGWWYRLAIVCLAVGLIAGFYLSGLHHRYDWAWFRANLTGLQQTASEHYLLAVLLFFLVYVLVTSLSLPVAVWLTLLGGALFERWVGTAVVSVAATIGATVAMLASRYVLHDWVQRHFGRRLAAISQGIERNGAYYLLTLRLIPVMPFWLLNLGMGLSPIRTRTYILITWVGMLPATVVYVNAGTELGRIETPADVLTPQVVGALLLLACLPLVIRFFIARVVRPRREVV